MSLINGTKKQWRKQLKVNLSFDKSKSLLNQNQNEQSFVYNKKHNKPFLPRNVSCNCIFNNNFQSNASKKGEYKRCFKLSNSFQINNSNSKQIINPLEFTFKHSFFNNQCPPIHKKHVVNKLHSNKIKLAILNLNDNKNHSINDYSNGNETPRFNSKENKHKKILNPIMKSNFSLNNLYNYDTYKKVNISFNMNNNRQKMLLLKHKLKKLYS